MAHNLFINSKITGVASSHALMPNLRVCVHFIILEHYKPLKSHGITGYRARYTIPKTHHRGRQSILILSSCGPLRLSLSKKKEKKGGFCLL